MGKCNITDKELADALDITLDRLATICDFFDSKPDDDWELISGTHFEWATHGARVFSSEGAVEICKYLEDNKQERPLFKRWERWLFQRDERLKGLMIAKRVQEISELNGQLVFKNGRAFLAPRACREILNLGTRQDILNRTFTEIQRSENTEIELLKIDSDFFDHEQDKRYFSRSGLASIGKQLGIRHSQKHRQDWSKVVAAYAPLALEAMEKHEADKDRRIEKSMKRVRDQARGYCQLTGRRKSVHKFNLVAHHLFDKDSYPYSAISSFALHPKLLCVQKMAYTFSEEILEVEEAEIQRLNKLSFCDHSGVMMLKFAVLKRIFFANTNNFITDEAFLVFFNANKEWLVPYAAFCSLRDNYGTLNYDEWGEFSEYSTDKIAAILEPTSPYYGEVLFWYFVQYHLHLQLLKASQYAHKRGVILKADLPIGVGRYSADTWVNPHLFHLDKQAGAPPDAFSTKGQNWSFPTYNIGVMASDNFAWFKKRMQQLENYFDAVRIDHVLGLFRIWSIPINQTDGTMGVFVPAIPANLENIINAGLVFNYNRFCTPFITEDLLQQMFGKDMPAIKEIFFDSDYKFKTAFNDQQKIATYFKFNPTYFKYEQKLFDLISNVILFRDTLNANGYHFRINMAETHSYKKLSETEKNILSNLYTKYYYESQNELWKVEGTARLKMLKKATGMLLCAEDLGMVPDFIEEVLHSLDIISLQVQQMPKTINSTFSDTTAANYESVVMPSTHDMQPIRLWWEKNKDLAQLFYNTVLNEQGAAPYFCEPWVCKKIIEAHLQSPAMWSIFLLQDLLAINGNIRRPNPAEERINDPSNADNVWSYRMHISVEDLLKQDEFNGEVRGMIKRNGR